MDPSWLDVDNAHDNGYEFGEQFSSSELETGFLDLRLLDYELSFCLIMDPLNFRNYNHVSLACLLSEPSELQSRRWREGFESLENP